ncbi:hypothetical protein RCL1_001380 [Eukaryota sp. TZLM3-RCL]
MPLQGLASGRVPYTPEQDEALINIVAEKERELEGHHPHVPSTGNVFWQQLEEQLSTHPSLSLHSWQSLRTHYLRHLKSRSQGDNRGANSRRRVTERVSRQPPRQQQQIVVEPIPVSASPVAVESNDLASSVDSLLGPPPVDLPQSPSPLQSPSESVSSVTIGSSTSSPVPPSVEPEPVSSESSSSSSIDLAEGDDTWPPPPPLDATAVAERVHSELSSLIGPANLKRLSSQLRTTSDLEKFISRVKSKFENPLFKKRKR